MSRHGARVVLVTGAGQGIGRAIADAHIAVGANVAYLDQEPALSETGASEARAGGGKAIGVTADVADFASVEAAVARVQEALGAIDVLVSNAGISPKSGPGGRRVDFWAMDPAEWRRVIDVNLTGAFNCARAVSPAMRGLGRGRIIHISSVVARTHCDIVAAHYAASKAALIGLTKHLAGELGPFGITVNALAPGRIETPLMRGTAAETNEAVRLATPLRRLGLPEEVAAACIFLTSDQGAFVTGQTIDVSGGWLLT